MPNRATHLSSSQKDPALKTERVQPLHGHEILTATGVSLTLLGLAAVAVNAVGVKEPPHDKQQDTKAIYTSDVSGIEAQRTAQYIPQSQLSIDIVATDPSSNVQNITPDFQLNEESTTSGASPLYRP